jgi:membrane protease YdiL (CAAX protease family)
MVASLALDRLYKNRLFLVVELALLAGGPLTLLMFSPQLMEYRHQLMIAIIIYFTFVAYSQHLSMSLMGLHKNRWKESVISTLPLSLLVALGITLIGYLLPHINTPKDMPLSYVTNWPIWLIILSYVAYSVPVQEFLFRGFLISRLELVTKNQWILIMVSGLLFAAAHLPFANKWVALGTLPIGLWCAHAFLTHRNLLAPSIIHGVIGGVYIAQWFMAIR